MSEQASEQGGLAGHSSGASTFPGLPTSGGWVPILAQPKEGGRPFVIDWSCPRCKRLTGNYRSCPHCGLEVLVSPKNDLPIPKGRKIYGYRRWAAELFEEDDDIGSLRRHPEPVRKADPEQRPGTSAKNKR